MQKYAHKLTPIYNSLHENYQKFKPSDVNDYKQYLRAILHPVVLDAPFVKRAFEKPLGYAGDFMLMAMLYHYEDIEQSSLFIVFFIDFLS